MVLSDNLISSFVKVTSTGGKKKQESIHYATVKKVEFNEDGTMTAYVRLDGDTRTDEDSLIPASCTVGIKMNDDKVTSNDRVVVMIKNHSVVVTGNITSPSVENKVVVETVESSIKKIEGFDFITANKASFEQLFAENGTIETLQAEDVRIAGMVEANTAKIDELESEIITTENLEAVNAEIEKLKTDKLNASDADIKYATIERLESSEADIDGLEADVGDINTLMFGSASGDTLHVSFANAVITLLGEAWIKSAMIDSIAASKITSGDIITNNVRVKSEDGSLLISDETLQISDGNRVRVQIGKDASNDYSINIWDTEGNLMFSKGGITDSAIKTAIIRNDMVSDTANIHASKLDIDSLFEEINGSTKTIKSTKIYLDSESQTLDLAFSSLSTELENLKDSTTSQGTSISAVQGQIQSKVWQQDINNATDAMSTQYSTLEQRLDSFESTVSNTYTTKDELDDLTIGGRNLLWNTNQGKTHWSAASLDGAYVIEDYECLDGVSAVKITTETASSSWAYTAFYMNNTVLSKLIASTNYIVSFDMLTNVTESLNLSIRRGDALKILAPNSKIVQTNNDEQWHKYEFELVTNDLAEGIDGQCLYFSRFNTVGYRIIKNLKLEKGNKATDWTPAPEDLTNRMTSSETKISQNTESIELTASKLKNEYSTTEQMNAAIDLKASGISSTVSELRVNLDKLSIGGRNLFTGYGDEEIRLKDYNGVGGFRQFTGFSFDASYPEYLGKEFTVSLWAKSPNGKTALSIYNSNGSPRYFHFNTTLDNELDNEWKYYTYTFTNTDRGESYTGNYTRLEIYASAQLDVLVKKIKVEMGNRATDWTPAPEYMATNNELETIQSSASLIEQRVSTSETLIQQLADSISMLVTDSNGESLMTQTDTGWTFSTEQIQSTVNTVSENLDAILNDVNDVNSVVEVLQQAVDDLGVLGEYIQITTYEDEPCIELGELDSDFKLRITNTRMMFMEGSVVLAYFTNQSFHSKKVVIEEELKQGGFVWKVRSNGNLGLVWKGGSN